MVGGGWLVQSDLGGGSAGASGSGGVPVVVGGAGGGEEGGGAALVRRVAELQHLAESLQQQVGLLHDEKQQARTSPYPPHARL
jgi:hypothetical protein